MMALKLPVWLLLALIVFLLVMDLLTFWVVRLNMTTALDLALDAAMIAAIEETDLLRGKSFIDETKAQVVALKYFRENLALNEHLENKFLKKTNFELNFRSDGLRPLIFAEVNTTVVTHVPKLVGREGIEITISQEQYYLQNYKNLAPTG
ncbi:MAG TPA: hypothetical protein GX687_06285 [Clostridia bacterium]|jgi:hypothetical protein|nr:hypothetical protein [Clostridia bacterium]